MSEAKKVSFNQSTAADTEKHNDRTLYDKGYEDRDKNIHWDCYGCGGSFVAERRFYEETFGKVLENQNQRAIDMRKYERVMDMDTWHSKHPPKECIAQLGCVGNNDDVTDYCIEVADKLKEKIESLGGTVLSWDIHVDEETVDEDTGEVIKGTPHLHMRYLFLVTDKDGLPKIDMKNCLLQHGVEPPYPEKKIDKINNPAQTFLDDVRDMLEDYADEYEAARGNPPVDRKRVRRPQDSVAVYKAKKMAAAAEQRAAEAEQREAEAVARVEAMQQTLDNAIADRDAAIADRDAAKAECAKLRRRREALAGDEYRTKGGGTAKGVAGLKKEWGALAKDIQEKTAERDALVKDIEEKGRLADSEAKRFRRNREAADSAGYHMEDWLEQRLKGTVNDSAFTDAVKRVGRQLLNMYRKWEEKMQQRFDDANMVDVPQARRDGIDFD